ncbi:hypothetical protein QBZ16_003112 [Prototheca wickerhamii]|uniref:Inositol-phosphate phosphatase n=1 Tax=Prototheca wickerhamii TaxID=3111 RepID=A0AAD9ILJ2_PROWI|nr:hypothetical protein QBZ16_003112 [Prototheca wickerhamii]
MEVVLANADRPRIIRHKGASDLVTDTDAASEAAILAAHLVPWAQVLRESFPEHAVLGEEGGVSGDPRSGYLWCVDPLDGTTNFAHGYPSFAVSVGVLRRATPVAGVVIEFGGGPGSWSARRYEAAADRGATCDGRPLRVSPTRALGQSLLVTGFGYDHEACWAANMDLFRHLTDVTQGFELKPWDVAAGLLIAREAGAVATTMLGGALSVFDRSLLVSNGELHEPLLQLMEPKMEALARGGADFGPWFVPEGYGVHTGPQLEN